MANTSRAIEDLVPWVSLRQIEFWSQRGYVRSETRGTGDPRTFPPEERRVLVAMARLVRAGIPPELASRIARKAIQTAGTGTKARILISPAEDDGGIIVEVGGL